jgi:hypothetical protein
MSSNQKTETDGRWFYASGKRKTGPFSFAQLQQFALAGQLLPSDMVFQEGSSKWIAARGVAGLFLDEPAQDVRSCPTSRPAPHQDAPPASRAASVRPYSGRGGVESPHEPARLSSTSETELWALPVPAARRPASAPRFGGGAEAGPKAKSAVWGWIGSILGAIILALILLAKSLGPALSHQQNQPVPNQSQNSKPANPQPGR